MTAQQFIPYARQSIDSNDIEEVSKALASDFITRGPIVEAFEQAVAEYCGAKYGVAFNSGTSALIAACYAAELGPSDRVISTPNTFVATTTAALHFNAVPVFVDIDLDTGNMNLNQVELNIQEFQSSRGRTVIMPVHYAGIPVDMQRLYRMIKDPKTVIIEDAAQALGSSYAEGKKVGCCEWSDMTIFSFHPAKIVTTGEGGMVMTNDAHLNHRLRQFRNNCIERDVTKFQSDPSIWYDGFFEAVDISSNYNFTDFQAALGISQLKKIESSSEKRKNLINVYRRLLQGVPHIKMLTDDFEDLVAFHLCVVQIDFAAYNTTRAAIMSRLKEMNIGTQMHYIPVYRHPFFKEKFGEISEYFPNMETFFAQALTLPLYNDLKEEDIEHIVTVLKQVLEHAQKSKKVQKEHKPHSRGARLRHGKRS